MNSPQKIMKELEGYAYQPRVEQARVDKDRQDRLDYLGYMDAAYRLSSGLTGD